MIGGNALDEGGSAVTTQDTGLALAYVAPTEAPAEIASPELQVQLEATDTPTPQPEPTVAATEAEESPTPEEPAPLPEREPFPDRDESRLYVEYVVQEGDTLGVIADHYELSVDDLFWSNPGLADSDLVIEGATLRIPAMDGIVHMSVGGETVYDVAVKYGVTIESLTWFSANDTPQPFQTLENGREVLVLHANPPVTDEAPPPAEGATGAPSEPPSDPNTTEITPTPGEGDQPPAEGEPAQEPTPNAEVEPTADAGADPGCVPTVENAPCFIWPVDGNVTSGFGPRSDVGFHDGIDIDVPNDGNHTQIFAAAAGDVAWAGCDDSGYGCYVILDHGFGWKTRYDHFTSIDVAEGQHVEQGQLLGLSGCTGYCRGEHLHFAILFEGKAVDPIGYLPPR